MIAAMLLAMVVAQAGAAGQGTAADGVWKARYTTTEKRQHEFTLTIKTADGAIAGTVSSGRGNVPITKGTVTGRDVEFTVTRRANYDEIDVTFKGTIDGDVMQVKMQVAGREPVSVTARREAAGTEAR